MLDCIIPVSRRDRFLVRKTVELLNKHVHPDTIYAITHRRYIASLEVRLASIANNVIVLDEDLVVNGLTVSHVTELLKQKYGDTVTGGWYFQQFLKMGFAISEYCRGDYLVWDADTLPIKHIRLIDNSGRKIFRVTNEHHVPYFKTMQLLLNLEPNEAISYISEYMLIDRSIMQSLISEITKNTAQSNLSWHDRIIEAADPLEYNSFSEFETYGAYASKHYAHAYSRAASNSYRDAGKQISRLHPVHLYESRWPQFDIISLEHQMSPIGFMGFADRIAKIGIYLNDKYFKIIR